MNVRHKASEKILLVINPKDDRMWGPTRLLTCEEHSPLGKQTTREVVNVQRSGIGEVGLRAGFRLWLQHAASPLDESFHRLHI